MPAKIFRVKVLDLSYKSELEQLHFRYLTYESEAENKEEALKKVRAKYMTGEKELIAEEIPFLLKIFCFV